MVTSGDGPGRRPLVPVLAGVGAVLAVVLTVVVLGASQDSSVDEPATAGLAGVVSFPDLPRGHRPGRLTYPQSPPAGGDHSAVWSGCDGTVYTEQIPQENATHSLEHGAVWVTVRPDLPQDQFAALSAQVTGIPYRMLSPYPGLSSSVVLTAWGRQLAVDSAQDPRVQAFLESFTAGPGTPEPGATCAGGTTATGTEPAVTPG